MEQPKILIFEDNPSIRTLLQFFCKRRSFTPIINEDAVDAVALVALHNPALIFMDLIMPGKDGVQACRELRTAGVKIPIIVLSSKPDADDRRRALEAGGTVFMAKPFDPAKLEETIRTLLP